MPSLRARLYPHGGPTSHRRPRAPPYRCSVCRLRGHIWRHCDVHKRLVALGIHPYLNVK